MIVSGVLLALAAQAAAAPSAAGGPQACTQLQLQVSVTLALEARKRGDAAAARSALKPMLDACPPTGTEGYNSRALAARLAAERGDWRETRRLLAELPAGRPGPLEARVAFLRLAADRALGDTSAFASDRAALMAADDAGLMRRGRRLETFRAGPYRVTAYEAAVTQGAFKRLLELIATPDEAAAYPVAVMLTDDTNVDRISTQAAAKAGQAIPPGRVFFVDLYRCRLHSTLQQRTSPDGAAPSYAEIKAMAIRELTTDAGATASTSRPPDAGTVAEGACQSADWLAPGLTPTEEDAGR